MMDNGAKLDDYIIIVVVVSLLIYYYYLFHGRAFAKLPLQSRTGWGGTHHVTQIQKIIIQIRPSLPADFIEP
jgi:hypothetical protein